MNIENQVIEILDRYHNENGASVGDLDVCPRCNNYTLECVSNTEDNNGVHSWDYKCTSCGYEAGERW